MPVEPVDVISWTWTLYSSYQPVNGTLSLTFLRHSDGIPGWCLNTVLWDILKQAATSLRSVTACLWRHSSSSLGYSFRHAAAAAVTLFFSIFLLLISLSIFSSFLYLFCFYLLFIFIFFLFLFLFFFSLHSVTACLPPLPLLYARPIRWWHIAIYG